VKNGIVVDGHYVLAKRTVDAVVPPGRDAQICGQEIGMYARETGVDGVKRAVGRSVINDNDLRSFVYMFKQRTQATHGLGFFVASQYDDA
jgi:hypothetical protein